MQSTECCHPARLSFNTVFLSWKNVFYYFLDQLWFAMCAQIITDTHVTLGVTHKNNPNVRQIITLARSGLFMEYCCLVLGVYVSRGKRSGGKRGVYFKLISIKTDHREAARSPSLLLDYSASWRLLTLLRSNSVVARLYWGKVCAIDTI